MDPIDDFAATGFVRLNQVIGPKGPIPVSRSTWYAGIKTGRFPKPVALGPRAVGYRVEEIRALIESFGDQDPVGTHTQNAGGKR